eukprot:TRINITY_DN6861_c0_g3_i1.p1 TRINITY_DN6861_c0_g3~~TRINITY_DN6861_c0_g3_i1.p1  ORF type:complete len:633 (-),score=164.27 TRINITY_DN6861_c0_g3_i1:40-1731(-)
MAPLTHRTPISTGTEYGGAATCWSASSDYIFFASNGKLHRVKSDGGLIEEFPSIEATKCYSPQHSASNDTLVFCSESKTSIGVGLIRNPLQSDISQCRVESIESKEIFHYDPACSPTNPDSLILTCWSPPNMAWDDSFVRLYSIKDGTFRTLIPTEDQSSAFPKWSPDGKHIAFVSDVSGHYNLHLCDADGNNVRNLHPSQVDVALPNLWGTGTSSLLWITNDRIVFTTVGENGNFDLNVIDISSGKLRKLTDVPKGIFYDLRSTMDGIHVIAHFSNQAMRQILLINVDTCSHKILLTSGMKMSEEVLSRFVAPKKLRYMSEGVECNGLLYVQDKESKERHPLLIFAHGGPTGGAANRWYPITQYFASRGWAVFFPNYRGSIHSGRKYRQSLKGNWGLHDVEDCKAAVEHLIALGIADPKACVMSGGSAGGWTTLSILIKYPGLFQAGIPLCAVSNLGAFDVNTHLLEMHYNQTLIGTDTKIYSERSPHLKASQIVDPILILHGKDDTVVPLLEHAIPIQENAKGIVEFKYYDGDHMFDDDPENARDIFQRMEAFMNKYALAK